MDFLVELWSRQRDWRRLPAILGLRKVLKKVIMVAFAVVVVEVLEMRSSGAGRGSGRWQAVIKAGDGFEVVFSGVGGFTKRRRVLSSQVGGGRDGF